MKRAVTAAALAGAAVVAGLAAPAAAGPAGPAAGPATAADVLPFGSPHAAIGGCGPAYAGADGVVTSDGSARGFATCLSETGPIRFYDRAGDGTVHPSEGTGFTGEVLAATADSTATYVMYLNGTTLYVGKRTNAGAFSSRAVLSGVPYVEGADLVARDGRWLGVWSRPVAGTGSQHDLFQAGTGSVPTRITTNVAEDITPTLAYDGATPVLVWSRRTSVGADLRTADLVGGAWRSTTLATVGTYNVDPDIAVAGGNRFVTWGRDGSVMVAGDQGGSYTSRRFAIGGYGPKVAATTGAGGVVDAVFVTYTDYAAGGGTPFFAETRGTGGAVTGTWSGRYLVTPTSGLSFLPVAVGGVGGKATVTYRTSSTVVTIRQN